MFSEGTVDSTALCLFFLSRVIIRQGYNNLAMGMMIKIKPNRPKYIFKFYDLRKKCIKEVVRELYIEEWGMDEMKALEMLAEQACHCLDFNFCESVRIFHMDGTEVTNKEISWL